MCVGVKTSNIMPLFICPKNHSRSLIIILFIVFPTVFKIKGKLSKMACEILHGLVVHFVGSKSCAPYQSELDFITMSD